ncbi:SRPBCC family protein [Terrabacter sp. NPDC080008]|uniref:SRPBCC family protein n=1 Tax=Terrabacter sp. NPDC080008 TaxID=3155176 RepID=UPI00344EC205
MSASVVRFESRTIVRRPASEVFACLADLPGYGTWMHRDGVFGRVELTSPAPVGCGTTYVDRTRMGPFVGEVTEHVPSSRVAFRETLSWFGRPLMQARPGYVLEALADDLAHGPADGGATVVHHVAEAELHGPMRLFRPVVAWMATRERTRTLASLERALAPDGPRRAR